MKTVSMSGSPRENVGKKDAKEARNKGLVPCVLYGGSEQVSFCLAENDLKKILYTPNVFIIKIDVNGKEYQAIKQDVQYHPVSDAPIHVDFLELQENKKVKLDIPVSVIGTAPGVREGGRLVSTRRYLKITALPKDLPDVVEVKVDDLNLGDSIKIEDIKIPGVDFLEDKRKEIVAVKSPKRVVLPDATATPEAEAAATTEGGEEEKKEAAPAEA